MADTKTITGVDAVTTFVMEQLGERKQPVPVTIGRGQQLPENLKAGEEERLEKLGAFEEKTDAEKIRHNQRTAAAQAAAATAERAAADAGATPTPTEGGGYDELKVDEAIAFLENVPEAERESYFERERDKGRKGVLEHFDQSTE